MDWVQSFILNDEHNSICFDCKTEKSTQANVTYGTLHCQACAKSHIELFFATNSFMKSFEEPWDPQAFKAVQAGGNKAFEEFLTPYKMGKREKTIQILYKSDCGTYWRKMIRAKVYGWEYNKIAPAKTFNEGWDQLARSFTGGMDKITKDLKKTAATPSKSTRKEQANAQAKEAAPAQAELPQDEGAFDSVKRPDNQIEDL